MRDSGLVLFQDGFVGIKNGFLIHPSIRQGGGPMQLGHVAYWQILLQKSFRAGARKFLEPLMRLARGDVRDQNASSKIDHGPPYWR